MMTAAAGILILLILVPSSVPGMALGYGVLDEPAGEELSAGPLKLSGWATDPNGIARVEAVTANGLRQQLAHTPSRELAKFFPVGATPVRFSGSLDLEGSESGLELRILITSKTGQESVIDRRWMMRGERSVR